MLKSILKRFGKGATAYILASMAVQVTPLCTIVLSMLPTNLLDSIGTLGLQPEALCSAGLGALILAGEKALNYNSGGNSNAKPA